MRIGQMISGRGLDGTSRYCQLLTRELAGRGHEVTLFHRPDAWIAANLDSARIRLVETPFKRSFREISRVRAIVRDLSIEVLHTHYSSANAFGMLLRMFGVRQVATGHSCHLQPAWFFADRVIAPTEEVARYHNRVNLVSRRRIDVVPNFIDCAPFLAERGERRASFRRELGVQEEAVLVGMVGSFGERKRHKDLVAAVAQARARGADVKLLLVGSFGVPAVLTGLRAAIAETEMEEHVHVRLDEPDLVGLLAALDIYGFSSNFEAGPLSILEAMAARLPVVTADVGAARLFVREGETGEIVPIGDVEAFGRALANLASDPQRRARYGEAGRRRVMEGFSVEAAAARIEQVFAAAAR